jgi:hypothetical protein
LKSIYEVVKVHTNVHRENLYGDKNQFNSEDGFKIMVGRQQSQFLEIFERAVVDNVNEDNQNTLLNHDIRYCYEIDSLGGFWVDPSLSGDLWRYNRVVRPS